MRTHPLGAALLLCSTLAACHKDVNISDPPFDEPDHGFPFDGDFGAPGPSPINQPQFGATVTQPTPPPPLSGGTLTVLADGKTAVAADPDRDRIYVVDLDQQAKLSDLPLSAGDEPGRVLEDGKGRVHVILRSGGAVLTLSRDPWAVSARRPICPAPRGLAWNADTDQLYVACAGGELMTLPAAGGDATLVVQLDRDLRDVLVRRGQILVSRFRSAELLTLDLAGHILARTEPALEHTSFGPQGATSFSPAAAWRLVSGPGQDDVYLLHQRGADDTITTSKPGGYGGGSDPCHDPIVHSTISQMTPGTTPVAGPALVGASLAVDLAFAHHDDKIAVLSAGNAHNPGLPSVSFTTLFDVKSATDCSTDRVSPWASGGMEPIALAFTGDDRLVVQSREPAKLILADSGIVIMLSGDSKADTGHAVFHANSGAGLACASCHLEGGEDGRVWSFENSGPRRTQSLRGGILGTEPFHWDGDQASFSVLMAEVFGHRMSGPALQPGQLMAMQTWVNRIPLIPAAAPIDPAAVERGRTLFQDGANLGCASCHAGPLLTDNASVDVGTGAPFQVPSLRGLAWRAPFLHDGRAATLMDRFGAQGGGDLHGHTSQLTSSQLGDLVAYLESL